MPDHLLSPHGQRDRLLARECQSLIHGIRVETLRAAQHRCERLRPRANQVYFRLLRCKTAARRLGMKAAEQ